MIAALAPLYFGEFASYREVLVTRDDPRPSIPARTLLERERLDSVLRRFDPSHADGDRRALASQWSKWYLVRIIPPAVAAAPFTAFWSEVWIVMVVCFAAPLEFRNSRDKSTIRCPLQSMVTLFSSVT